MAPAAATLTAPAIARGKCTLQQQLLWSILAPHAPPPRTERKALKRGQAERPRLERAGMIEGLHINNERTLINSKAFVLNKGTCIRRQRGFINEAVRIQPAQQCRHFGARRLLGYWGFAPACWKWRSSNALRCGPAHHIRSKLSARRRSTNALTAVSTAASKMCSLIGFPRPVPCAPSLVR